MQERFLHTLSFVGKAKSAHGGFCFIYFGIEIVSDAILCFVPFYLPRSIIIADRFLMF